MKTIKVKDYILKNEDMFRKIYKAHNDPESIKMSEMKIKDHFDFLVGQVITIGLVASKSSKSKMHEMPVLVTSVNPPDENGHNTYDFVMFVRGNCEFIPTIDQKERYLWRMCTKTVPDELTVRYLIGIASHDDFIKDYQITPQMIHYLDGDTLCFPDILSDDEKILFNNNIDPRWYNDEHSAYLIELNNTNIESNRVAFIEKTPRVFLNDEWVSGPMGSEEDPNSRDWCIKTLVEHFQKGGL